MTVRGADVVIIGAGTAGCVLADRLSADGTREVVLIEAGSSLPSEQSLSADYISAIEVPGRMWPGDPQRARGVGGGASVNGMVALFGPPADYDRWAELGAAGWAWADIEARAIVMSAEQYLPLETERNAVDRALFDAAGGAPQAKPAPLAWRDGCRYSAYERHLAPARNRANLELKGDTEVARVLFAGSSAVGVACADGTTVESRNVFVACGAHESPALLRRSGVGIARTPLQPLEHDSITIPFTTSEAHAQRAPEFLSSVIAYREVRCEHLALQAIGLLRATAGAISVGVFAAELGDAAAWVSELVRHPALKQVIEEIGPVSHGVYSHASSTLPMPSHVDTDGRVIGVTGLWVADASVFPSLPLVNPMLTVMLVADVIAERFVGTPVPN